MADYEYVRKTYSVPAYAGVRVDSVGGKHFRCDYFVLDLTHDEHAIPALQAYAQSCQEEYPLLAADLLAKLQGLGAEDNRNLRKAYRAGFEDCRNKAMGITDEHEGFTNRIELLEPDVECPKSDHEAELEKVKGALRSWRMNMYPREHAKYCKSSVKYPDWTEPKDDRCDLCKLTDAILNGEDAP